MSITIESSDNKEHFKRWGYDRFYAFYVEYIPKHLPKWAKPDAQGSADWTQSFEGYTSIIDYVVDEAIKTIIERPENNVVEFQLKALKNTIDLWTPEWDKEFAIYAISVFNSADAPKASDAYMTLYSMGYMDDEEPVETTSISKTESTFTWTHNSKQLDEVLPLFEAVSHLFEENGLNGFKMAVSGNEIDDVDYGCISPSNRNKTYVAYLFFKLLKAGHIGNYRDTDRDGIWEYLIGSSGSRKFRHYYSDFNTNSANLNKEKKQLIDEVIDAI